MTTKLLSPEELEERRTALLAGGARRSVSEVWDHIAALLKKMRAAGEALQNGGYVDLSPGIGNPGTTLLSQHAKALDDLRESYAELHRTLCRERDDNAKALARARNEGIAHVAAAYDADAAKAREKATRYAGQPIAREWANAADRCEADAVRIRAMKETEE